MYDGALGENGSGGKAYRQTKLILGLKTWAIIDAEYSNDQCTVPAVIRRNPNDSLLTKISGDYEVLGKAESVPNAKKVNLTLRRMERDGIEDSALYGQTLYMIYRLQGNELTLGSCYTRATTPSGSDPSAFSTPTPVSSPTSVVGRDCTSESQRSIELDQWEVYYRIDSSSTPVGVSGGPTSGGLIKACVDSTTCD
ncbi:MAG: hypothetical protein KGQ59_08020 [Bdellovibrionales bacterium]|nr:hypothetical protein [Bdellovibrionales bacterium]